MFKRLNSWAVLIAILISAVAFVPHSAMTAATYTPILASSLLDIQALTAESATQNFPIGTRIVVGERVFRYAKAGGTLAAGKALVAAAAAADHIDLVPSAVASAGDTAISLTNGASTAITANMYDEGYLFSNDGTDEGHMYRIASHTTAAVDAVATFTLTDALLTDVTADNANEFGLIKNAWSGVTHSATEELLFAGVPLIDVTDTYYFWCQTWGMAMMFRFDTAADGTVLSLGTNVAGQMKTMAEYTMSGGMAISHPHTGVQDEYQPVWLMVAP